MKVLLEMKSIQVSLVLVVALVWGYNALTIMEISTGEGEAMSVSTAEFDSTLLELPEQQAYRYNSDFRDPFQPALSRPAKKEKKPVRKKPPPIVLPELKLAGVIEGTAILRNGKRGLFFAAVGDTVEGARVTAVAADSVVLVFKSKEFTVKL